VPDTTTVDVPELDRLRRSYLYGAKRLTTSAADVSRYFDGSAFGNTEEGSAAADTYDTVRKQLKRSSENLSKLMEQRAESIRLASVWYLATETTNADQASRINRGN
jgi:hypothetical protein